MLAVLGHELRNPLAASMIGVSAVAEMTDPADPRSEFLRRALEDLERVSALLDRYLEFGRSGSVPTGAVDLGALLRRLADRQVIAAAGAAVEIGGDGGCGKVRGDAVLLERALENLLDNAVRAGARRIQVAVERRDNRTCLEIQDDGCGISEHLRTSIFEPFVSGSGSTGLGLALVAEVLESHGGDIVNLPSERGARFRVTLPALPRSGDAELLAVGQTGSAHEPSGRR